MAVSVVANNTSAYSDTGPTIALGGLGWTPLENDIIVVYLSCTNTFTFSTLSGWSLITENVTPGDNSTESGALYHQVTSTEETAGTTSYSLSGLFGGGTETGRWWAIVVRGVDPADPVDGYGTWFTAGDTDTAHQLAAITGTGLSDNSLVLRFISCDAASRTYTTPSGHTKLMDGGSNSGGWAGYRNTLTSAGVNVNAEATTVSTGDEGVSISVAMKVAATAPPANVHIKASGTFGDGLAKVKISGSFTDATVKTKSGGSWT